MSKKKTKGLQSVFISYHVPLQDAFPLGSNSFKTFLHSGLFLALNECVQKIKNAEINCFKESVLI